MDILPVFCDIDDFCQFFEPLWKQRLLSAGSRRRDRAGCLCLSEVMTVIVMFHSSSYRNFKAYYTEQVLGHYAGDFPRLPSYQRFVELIRVNQVLPSTPGRVKCREVRLGRLPGSAPTIGAR